MDRYEIRESKDYCTVNLKQKEIISFSNEVGKIRGVIDNYIDIFFDLKDFNKSDDSVEVLYESTEWDMRDKITSSGDGFFKIERTWKNTSHKTKNVVLNFEVNTLYESEFYLIPCVNYNGNKWGNGKEPKGLTYEGKPWIFAYDRSGLPSGTISEGKEFAVTTFVSDKNKESLVSACSLEKNESGMLHRILWPYREEPIAYISRDISGKGINDVITILPNKEFKTSFYLCVSNVVNKNFGFTFAYDRAEEVLKSESKALLSNEELWNFGIEYTKNIFKREREYSLFSVGYNLKTNVDKDGVENKYWSLNEGYEIGWCGQNATFACAMLENYLKNNDKESLKMGIDVLDTWVNNAVEPNGLFQINLSNRIKGSMNTKADTCNLGWGATQILTGYELAQKIGIDKQQWFNTGIKLCDFFIDNYDEENAFGKSWGIVSGKCIDWSGTIGCFIIMAMIKAYKITNDTRYITYSKKAYKRYVERDLLEMQCTAGALDTTCVDKETCWPLLKCGLDIYELTKEEYFLECAKKAAYYLLTWTYLYDVIYDEKCDFSKYGFHTYGATAVSAQHHHLDPWGGLICGDLVRLYKITGEKKWKCRAVAMWKNSSIGISDGKHKIHNMLRPVGAQNEAYFHCNWSFENTSNRRGVQNDWLVCWPTAFRLITLMDSSNWDELK